MKTRSFKARSVLRGDPAFLSGRKKPPLPAKTAPHEQMQVTLMGSPVPVHILATTRQELTTRRKSLLREPWTMHWIQHYIGSGEVLFDVGVNIGVFSLFCAVVHGHAVKIYAFEPGFANYNALCRNLLLNGCDESIIPVPLALYSETGSTVFKYRDVAAGGAMHAMGARDLESKPGQPPLTPVYEQLVFTLTLDEMMERYGLAAPGHLKIDVDGNEEAVLAGARETLVAPAVRSVMVEIGPRSDRDGIVGLLERAGLMRVREFDKQAICSDAFFGRDPRGLAAVLSTSPERMGNADLKRLRE